MADPSAPPDLAIPGLFEYNFTGNNCANKPSSNATTNGHLVGAQAAYIPGTDDGGFGSAGFLIFLGGSYPANPSFDPQSPSLVDMSNISLYEISGQT
jgi:energy-converting hydrogenase Eha subunit B